ncbi:MAG: hypothetical protein AVDCRST_MAG64-3872, partial [uncultured Phycisphaerae bacterium]
MHDPPAMSVPPALSFQAPSAATALLAVGA